MTKRFNSQQLKVIWPTPIDFYNDALAQGEVNALLDETFWMQCGKHIYARYAESHIRYTNITQFKYAIFTSISERANKYWYLYTKTLDAQNLTTDQIKNQGRRIANVAVTPNDATIPDQPVNYVTQQNSIYDTGDDKLVAQWYLNTSVSSTIFDDILRGLGKHFVVVPFPSIDYNWKVDNDD